MECERHKLVLSKIIRTGKFRDILKLDLLHSGEVASEHDLAQLASHFLFLLLRILSHFRRHGQFIPVASWAAGGEKTYIFLRIHDCLIIDDLFYIYLEKWLTSGVFSVWKNLDTVISTRSP